MCLFSGSFDIRFYVSNADPPFVRGSWDTDKIRTFVTGLISNPKKYSNSGRTNDIMERRRQFRHVRTV